MCTKAPKCKERTSKIQILNRYKRDTVPKKATVRQVKDIYHFDEVDLEAITEDDLQQPCKVGNKCPQEDIGIHSKACRVEMKGQAERPLGQTWDDVVQEQEAFKANPSEWTLGQNSNRYNHEDRREKGRRSRKDESEEEGEDM